MRSAFSLGLLASAVLLVSAFLPWLHLGDVGLAGVPDPAGYFVAVTGAVGLLLSGVGLTARRDTRQLLGLAGLAGVTTLLAVWLTGPATVASRALAHAEALALVDHVAMQPPPPVRVGVGLLVGLAASAGLVVVGVFARRTPHP